MDPFRPLTFPRPWRPDRWLVDGALLHLAPFTLEALHSALGPPGDADDEGDGLGPVRSWGVLFRCGLEVLVEFPLRGRCIALIGSWTEPAHVLRHVGDWSERVKWNAIQESPAPEAVALSPTQESWSVFRQDDNGNRFVMTHACSEFDADCIVATHTARGHKQVYWSEPAKRRKPASCD